MDAFELIVKMTGALALILGLMFLISFILRRFGLVAQGASKGLIEVIENRAILPKRYISLVRVAGSYFLIGSTEQGITLLGSMKGENLEGFNQVLSREVKKAQEMEAL